MVGVGAVCVRVCRQVTAGITVVERVSPGEEAKVQQAFWGTAPAALAASIVVEILHVDKPLRPEPPPYPLTEHRQVDQLSCRESTLM